MSRFYGPNGAKKAMEMRPKPKAPSLSLGEDNNQLRLMLKGGSWIDVQTDSIDESLNDEVLCILAKKLNGTKVVVPWNSVLYLSEVE